MRKVQRIDCKMGIFLPMLNLVYFIDMFMLLISQNIQTSEEAFG